METTFNPKKIVIALTLVLILIITIYFILSRGSNTNNSLNNPSNPQNNSPSTKLVAESKNLDDVPTLPPTQGGGLDTRSPLMVESASNIQKITQRLPYKKTLQTTSGIEVEIMIPSEKYQENRWTLLVYIYGIDYQIPKEDAEYTKMKLAFREAANEVYIFIKKNGGDPEKIVFKWGDRFFIDERAIEWLQ